MQRGSISKNLEQTLPTREDSKGKILIDSIIEINSIHYYRRLVPHFSLISPGGEHGLKTQV